MTIAEISRHIIGVLCITAYLMSMMGSTNLIALFGTGTSPVIVTECRGECALCGCSPEASALKLCCCARKKQLQNIAQQEGKSCCKKEHGHHTGHPEISPLPCGGGKYPDSGSFTSADHIPHRTQLTERAPGSALSFASVDRNGPNFHRPPPDPPPRIIQVSTKNS